MKKRSDLILTLQKWKDQATKAAKYSKPIVTPTMWTFSLTCIFLANVLLLKTTDVGFTIFFDSIFGVIIFFTLIGGYVRESIGRWLFTDLDRQIENRLVQVYVGMGMDGFEAKHTAKLNMTECTLDSIVDFIEQEEKKWR
jgi:hypothetical protein